MEGNPERGRWFEPVPRKRSEYRRKSKALSNSFLRLVLVSTFLSSIVEAVR